MFRFEKGRVLPSRGAKAPARAPARSKFGSTSNMASNIKVVVRVRPLNEKEKKLINRVVVDVVDDSMLVFDRKEEIRPFSYQGVQQTANKELKFVFDHVCDMNSTNQVVFETTTKNMLSALMEGYNCSVFVYGATGAGKTFTMIGNIEQPGITYLTMEQLFITLSSFENERDFDIAVSYIEVYNEHVYDLLKPSNTPLQLREDTKNGVMVAGLTLNSIKTAQELLNMLEDGNKNRTQNSTDANAESSRSHAVFQVHIKMYYKTSSQHRLVKLSMIDLAGSERATATGCVDDRFKEGANINKSLLVLGNCISRLADNCKYIPYRDSKLTRLLKDSLGGNCKTLMIATVSPSSISYEDTYNTLKYAARAKKIKLSIKKNIGGGDMRILQYMNLNEELKKKVIELEAKLTLSELTLSSVKRTKVVREADTINEKAREEWRKRLLQEEEVLSVVEKQLLSLMGRQRVLVRRRLRARAFKQVAGRAARAAQQISSEDLQRQTQAAKNYMKQSIQLDSNVQTAWTKWDACKRKLKLNCEQALSDCPELKDFIKNIQMQSEMRHLKARDELRHNLLALENEEMAIFTEYMRDMTGMLKHFYFTLKGCDKATPALTAEFLEIMKKAETAKGITWSDNNAESDAHFKFISNLELDKPSTTTEYGFTTQDIVNVAIDTSTDSDDLTDIENHEPVKVSAKKRKGTPIKLVNDDTTTINNSFEILEQTSNIYLPMTIKRDFVIAPEVENVDGINPDNLNSTLVLAGKKEAVIKPVCNTEKVENIPQPVNRGLKDRTNTLNRGDQETVNFGGKAGTVKPALRKAPSFRRLPAPAPAFGSSVSRFTTDSVQGFKAVRARERVQIHPYTRPPRPARK